MQFELTNIGNWLANWAKITGIEIIKYLLDIRSTRTGIALSLIIVPQVSIFDRERMYAADLCDQICSHKLN